MPTLTRVFDADGASILIDHDSRHAAYLPAPGGPVLSPTWRRISRLERIRQGANLHIETRGTSIHRFQLRPVADVTHPDPDEIPGFGLDTPPTTDRVVHSILVDGSEIARYGRDGFWCREWPPGAMVGLTKLKVRNAAWLAVDDEPRGGRTLLGRPGGRVFDRVVTELRAKTAEQE